jgi:tetratricopeptide (TPR) repeat protein
VEIMVSAEANAKTVKSRVRHKRFKIGGGTIERSDLSLLYHRKNDEIHGATKQFKKSFVADTKESRTHSRLGEALCAPLDVRPAIKPWEELLKPEPLITQLHDNLAAIYQSPGKPELAIAKWQYVLLSDPNNADALFGLGEAYEKLGECIKAVDCYQRYVKVVLPEKCRTKLAEERIQRLCRVIRAVYSCNVGGCL